MPQNIIKKGLLLGFKELHFHGYNRTDDIVQAAPSVQPYTLHLFCGIGVNESLANNKYDTLE